MCSKLLHVGGANVTTQLVRPVFYASFGDLGIEGPVYSLRKEPTTATRSSIFCRACSAQMSSSRS